jgi:hypothetical protein
MNYNSWKRKYPRKPFPYKLEKFDFFGKTLHIDMTTNAYQTAINNYGTCVFFGDTYMLSPTTIPHAVDMPSTENITVYGVV